MKRYYGIFVGIGIIVLSVIWTVIPLVKPKYEAKIITIQDTYRSSHKSGKHRRKTRYHQVMIVEYNGKKVKGVDIFRSSKSILPQEGETITVTESFPFNTPQEYRPGNRFAGSLVGVIIGSVLIGSVVKLRKQEREK